MIILALQSIDKTTSIAINDNEKTLASIYYNCGYMPSDKIIPMVEKILQDVDKTYRQIDAFAVLTGPGSFTGIRVAMTCVKTMAQALNKPVFSTDALTLLEAGVPCEKNIKIVGAIDALRNEIFVKNDRRQIVIKPIDEFCKTLKKYKSNLRIVGGAVNSYRQIMEKSLGKKALSLDEHFHLLKADVLATFAYKKLKPKKYFEISPVYIRKSWAEEKAQ